MPRSPATLDPFSAIGEPLRRDLLGALAKAGDEHPVNDLVKTLGWPQPQVSKHLAVLRQVGLVAVRRDGRLRMYRVNGQQLKTIYDWITMYEKFWEHQLLRIKARAERAAPPAPPAKKERHP